MIVPKDVKAGDRVRVTGIVKFVDPLGAGMEFDLNEKVDVQKLKHRRPEVGTVIDGARLADTWWKHGTLIREQEFHFMLNEHGRWISDWWGGALEDHPFVDFQNARELTVVYLP